MIYEVVAGPGGIEPPTPGLKAQFRTHGSDTSLVLEDAEDTISKFHKYCVVDERLSKRVSYDYRLIGRKFLEFSEGVVSKDTVRGYLGTYLDKAPKTYNNQLDGLRAFVSRFLKRSITMEGFKKPMYRKTMKDRYRRNDRLEKVSMA